MILSQGRAKNTHKNVLGGDKTKKIDQTNGLEFNLKKINRFLWTYKQVRKKCNEAKDNIYQNNKWDKRPKDK